jgi:hypothetical protein
MSWTVVSMLIGSIGLLVRVTEATAGGGDAGATGPRDQTVDVTTPPDIGTPMTAGGVAGAAVGSS